MASNNIQGLSRFVPRLKTLETVDWYGRRAVRGTGASDYHFLDPSEKVMLDVLERDSLDVGQLNEKLYELTGVVSPLRIVRFLLKLCRRNLLENGDELEALVPDLAGRKHAPRRRAVLGTIGGPGHPAGIVLPALFLAGVFVLAVFGAGFPGPPPLYPFPGHVVRSLAILPITVFVLVNLRGLFAILTMLLLRGRAGMVCLFPAGIPVLTANEPDIISAPPARRLLYHLTTAAFYPAVALAASALIPSVSRAQAAMLLLVYWEGAVLFLFDLYLLHRSPVVGLLEEFSREPSLAGKLRSFWRREFVTVESILGRGFSHEELFYAMGIFQLLWFFAYLFLFLYVLKGNASGLYRLTARDGLCAAIPFAATAALGTLFLLATILRFVLRKAASVTASLVDLASSLAKRTAPPEGSDRDPIRPDEIPGSDSLTEERKAEIADAANTIRGIPAFSALPRPVVAALAAGSSTARFRSGRIILEAGEASDGLFYVIRRGSVSVRKADGEHVELKPGDFFGEIALLSDSPRTATVTAGTDAEMLVFRKEDFVRLLLSDLDSILKLEAKGQERLAELSR